MLVGPPRAEAEQPGVVRRLEGAVVGDRLESHGRAGLRQQQLGGAAVVGPAEPPDPVRRVRRRVGPQPARGGRGGRGRARAVRGRDVHEAGDEQQVQPHQDRQGRRPPGRGGQEPADHRHGQRGQGDRDVHGRRGRRDRLAHGLDGPGEHQPDGPAALLGPDGQAPQQRQRRGDAQRQVDQRPPSDGSPEPRRRRGHQRVDGQCRQGRQGQVHRQEHPRRAADDAQDGDPVNEPVGRQEAPQRPDAGADEQPGPHADQRRQVRRRGPGGRGSVRRAAAGRGRARAIHPPDRPRGQGQRHQAHVAEHLAEVVRPPPRLAEEVRRPQAHDERQECQHGAEGVEGVFRGDGVGDVRADAPAQQRAGRGDLGGQEDQAHDGGGAGGRDRPADRPAPKKQVRKPHQEDVDRRRPVPRRQHGHEGRRHPGEGPRRRPAQALDRPQPPGQDGGGLDEGQVHAVGDHVSAEGEGQGPQPSRRCPQADAAEIQPRPAAGQGEGQEDVAAEGEAVRQQPKQPGRREGEAALGVGGEGHAGGLGGVPGGPAAASELIGHHLPQRAVVDGVVLSGGGRAGPEGIEHPHGKQHPAGGDQEASAHATRTGIISAGPIRSGRPARRGGWGSRARGPGRPRRGSPPRTP